MIVVGAGNAALCAALSAREQGASVVVLEKAPPSAQGGNCPFTGGGFRFVHDGIEDLRSLLPDLTDAEAERLSMAPYTAEDFRGHLTEVTQGDVDTRLMETLIANSRPTVDWMHAQGVTWELSGGRVSAGAPSVIPNSVGLSAWRSGPGLVQMLTTAARRAGITILYETKMLRLLVDDAGAVSGVEAQDADGVHTIGGRGVVLACGGFEANARMRAEFLGEGWERAKVRGSAHNTGDGHRAALEVGAQAYGQWTGCHATPIDVDAPLTGSVEITERMPRRSYPLGITVNRQGKRFFDEGAGFAEQTFVAAGSAILRQDGGVAFQIFDSRAAAHLEPRYALSRSATAFTVRELAGKLRVDADALEATVAEYNAAAGEGRVQAADAGRAFDARARSAEEQLGDPAGRAAFLGVYGYGGNNLYLRRFEGGRECPRSGRGGRADSGVVRGGRDSGRHLLPQQPESGGADARRGVRAAGGAGGGGGECVSWSVD